MLAAEVAAVVAPDAAAAAALADAAAAAPADAAADVPMDPAGAPGAAAVDDAPMAPVADDVFAAPSDGGCRHALTMVCSSHALVRSRCCGTPPSEDAVMAGVAPAAASCSSSCSA